MKLSHSTLVLALVALLIVACQPSAMPAPPILPAASSSPASTVKTPTAPVADRLATDTPICGIVCRDATSVALLTLTPLPPRTVTHNPVYYTQEALSRARMTREASYTKTPTPNPTPTFTPIPSDRPGFAIYQGWCFVAATAPPPLFRLTYAIEQWQLEDAPAWKYSNTGLGPSDLRRRHAVGCVLHLATLPGEFAEPITGDEVSLAGYTWERMFVADENMNSYSLTLGRDWYGFQLDLPVDASAADVLQCQSGAEAVIDTFRLVEE